MIRKIPVVYTYDIKHDILSQYFNLIRDEVRFGHQFNRPEKHVYAINAIKKIRIEIAPNHEEVFHAHKSDIYSVYMFQPDRSKAIELLSDYILPNLKMHIDHHEAELSRLAKYYSKVEEMYRDRFVRNVETAMPLERYSKNSQK